MKRKIGLIISLVVASVFLFGATASAFGDMDNDVSVVVDEIEITGETYSDETATFETTAYVTFGAEWVAAYGNWEVAHAYAELTLTSNSGSIIELDSDNEWLNSIFNGPIYPDTVIPISLTGDYTFTYDDEGLWKVTAFSFGNYAYGTKIWWYYKTLGWEHGENGTLKDFWVGAPHPEMHYRLTALGTDGTAAYADGSSKPMPILNSIDCNGRFWNGDNNLYRIVIPEGTIITNDRGEKVLCSYINGISGDTLNSTFNYQHFSNPVTVYIGEGDFVRDETNNWIGGTWVELGSFTEIVDYTATLN